MCVGLQQHFTCAKRASGGSAANSVIAFAALGGSAFYGCKVAKDENGDFYETIKPILDDYMGDYTLDRHPYTDVSILGAFYDFSCINYSVGYYNMHSPNEFVNVEHVNQAKNMAIEMISSLGNIKYQFIDQNASKMDKNRLREYALKSLTSSYIFPHILSTSKSSFVKFISLS